MERYDYVTITKQECFDEKLGDYFVFSKEKLDGLLAMHGREGFRIITKLYNSDGDWVLLLSRPLVINDRSEV